MNILLVDDNDLMQQVLRRFIRSMGHSVEVAATAAVALTLAQQQQFGLLLIDQRLPDYDGPEALERLRQLPGYERVPAVAISGFGMEHERAARAAGFNGFASKPIEFDTLQALIERYDGHMARTLGEDTRH